MSDEGGSQGDEGGSQGGSGEDTTTRNEGGDGGWDYPDLDSTNIKGGDQPRRIEANDDPVERH